MIFDIDRCGSFGFGSGGEWSFRDGGTSTAVWKMVTVVVLVVIFLFILNDVVHCRFFTIFCGGGILVVE